MKNKGLRTWIEVSKSKIRNNYRVFRKLLNSHVKIMGVIKSNAYGHELWGMAKALIELKIDWLGVDSITEAIRLRKIGIEAPILVLGYTLPENFGDANKYNISLTISDHKNLRMLKRGQKIHLKLDTGMHRQGFQLKDLAKALETLKKHKITPEGIYTHFGAAKKPDNLGETLNQINNFNQALKTFKPIYPKALVHASATAGTLNYPQSHYDLVRIGIGLYGLWPSAETKKSLQNKLSLKPALVWKSLISELKWVDKGEKVGYDYTEQLKRKTLLAVIPIGYWHGYWRAFSSQAWVDVNNHKAKIIGRVSMDMVVADVTDIPRIKPGDEVILLGKNITAEQLASLAGTTSYEIITKLNPLIKRFYIS